MRVKVRLFASLREALGRSDLSLELLEGTVEELLERISAEHPLLRPHLMPVRVAVNRAFAGPKTRIREGDEVALIPPVGGG